MWRGEGENKESKSDDVVKGFKVFGKVSEE